MKFSKYYESVWDKYTQYVVCEQQVEYKKKKKWGYG